MKLTLESQGSSASSAATTSKVTGTHFKPSTSGSSSSSGLSTGSGTKDEPRKTITELGGGGGTRGDGVGDFFKGMGGFGGGLGSLGGGDFATAGHLTTQTSSCTKTMKRTIVHTKDGPAERIEEVSGGLGCEALKHGGGGGGGGGGMGDFFPSLTSSSSSSSSSSLCST